MGEGITLYSQEIVGKDRLLTEPKPLNLQLDPLVLPLSCPCPAGATRERRREVGAAGTWPARANFIAHFASL